jgi:hypothetical protein
MVIGIFTNDLSFTHLNRICLKIVIIQIKIEDNVRNGKSAILRQHYNLADT